MLWYIPSFCKPSSCKLFLHPLPWPVHTNTCHLRLWIDEGGAFMNAWDEGRAFMNAQAPPPSPFPPPPTHKNTHATSDVNFSLARVLSIHNISTSYHNLAILEFAFQNAQATDTKQSAPSMNTVRCNRVDDFVCVWVDNLWTLPVLLKYSGANERIVGWPEVHRLVY